MPAFGKIQGTMRANCFYLWLLLLVFSLPGGGRAQAPAGLPDTAALTMKGDLSAQMVAGIDQFLMREIGQSRVQREKLWRRDFASPVAYQSSVEPNREHFRQAIGAVDPRLPATGLEFVISTDRPGKLGETAQYTIWAVRWPVFDGVFGEGLLLQPKTQPLAAVIAIPDADQTPEMLAGLAPGIAPEAQFARRLAENGCLVLVPVLVSRQDTFSGNAALKRFTNQPHREWIYRQAFELGRHIIGYEAQKVLGAVDWLTHEQDVPNSPYRASSGKIGVAGYGEGGLIAFYSAALDTRIQAALVSGYFDSRQRVWEEPIYRNVFGLLHEFGDAEIASLVAPRPLIVEHSETPAIAGPPPAREGRSGAAPGRWATPEFSSVESEAARARALAGPFKAFLELVHGNEGMSVGPGSEYALKTFLKHLGVAGPPKPLGTAPALQGPDPDAAARQYRQAHELEEFTQKLLRDSENVRAAFFWNQLKATNDWAAASRRYKDILWEEVIGRFPKSTLPPKPRSRQLYEKPAWTGYEVVLDVYPDVFAWGYLLVPKDLKAGERRPVVVCQHGLEGVPEDVVTKEPAARAFGYYRGYAARLAERGFVVYAPHNPYRGGDSFRVLQRKANPLKKSLFSIILAQHERTLEWLAGLPFVDPARIGFYGLSYGGKTAMRVPALLDGYCLSICSADFNEWVKKNATTESGYSYLFTGEYEMPEFNLGHTFNYAEMAALIAPRPFMVERGHHDGVAPDEWVAYEYARVRRCYAELGIPERTEIEFFNGPHSIHGVGTFQFLHRHLNWPEPK